MILHSYNDKIQGKWVRNLDGTYTLTTDFFLLRRVAELESKFEALMDSVDFAEAKEKAKEPQVKRWLDIDTFKRGHIIEYNGDTYYINMDHDKMEQFPPGTSDKLYTLREPDIPEKWQDKSRYLQGQRVEHKGIFYLVLVDHESDKAKEPDVTPEWYERI